MNKKITVGEALSMLQNDKLLTHFSNGEISHKAYSVDESTVLTCECPENDKEANAIFRVTNLEHYKRIIKEIIDSEEFIIY